MNQSSAKLYSVKEVPAVYKALFNEDVNFFDVLRHVDHVLRAAGTYKPMFLFKGTVAEFELHLPCNVDSIEYVCGSQPVSWWAGILGVPGNTLINYRVDQSGNLGAYNPNATNYEDLGPLDCELYVVNKNVFYGPQGYMIDFRNDNNCCLAFNYKDLKVDVLFKGKVLDADKYPMVSDKCLEAIAKYYHYVLINRKYYAKQVDINMREAAKQEYSQAVAQARTPDSISMNELDATLNTMYSYNRKQYNQQLRKI